MQQDDTWHNDGDERLPGDIKIWLNQTYDLQITILGFVITNKNHGQPFIQYAERR